MRGSRPTQRAVGSSRTPLAATAVESERQRERARSREGDGDSVGAGVRRKEESGKRYPSARGGRNRDGIQPHLHSPSKPLDGRRDDVSVCMDVAQPPQAPRPHHKHMHNRFGAK